MYKIVVSFGTEKPFRFMEPSLNEEFEARLYGKAYVSEYDISRYPSEDDPESGNVQSVIRRMKESSARNEEV